MFTWPPPYQVKRHRRAKYVKFRISKEEGLIVTVPVRFSLRELPVILEEFKPWIEKNLIDFPKTVLELPEKIELKACQENWIVSYLTTNSNTKIAERSHFKELVLMGKMEDKNFCKEKILDWVREKAKIYLPSLLQAISRKTQLEFEDVTIRDQKTLWGSCTSKKMIHLNYKLLFLPLSLVEHVMIHELSHTIHLNHSKRFWNLVALHDQNWREHYYQLKKAGNLIPVWAT